ncbi:O-antigen polysaccharide polymerase Wzy [Sorangium sp. So ce119]|uniref:O-antigen polysaccharide polymerase Wzy n=1 Tax=Sorangium sp. So ce119 TaxID=3133279 RepID=UPI003F5F59C8
MLSPRLPPAGGARRAAQPAPTRKRKMVPRGRLVAVFLVATLATVGPILESSLGDGRGWTIGLLLLLVAPSLARAGGPRFHPLDPETYIPAAYFLTVGYTPILKLLTSYGFHLPSYDAAAMEVSYAGAIGCALACTALSRLPESPNLERVVPVHRPTAMLDRDWAAILVGLFGFALVIGWIASIGVGQFFTMDYASNHLVEDGKGLLTSGWYPVKLVVAYLFLRVASVRKAGLPVPKTLLIAGSFFFATLLLTTIMGRRGPLVWTVLAIGLTLHAYGIQIRRMWLAAGMVCILFYGIAVEGARARQGHGFDAQITSAMSRLETIENPLEIGELRMIHSNLVNIVNERPPIVTYAGESWINAFLILIPRPLWSDRPLSLGQRYAWWKAPDMARHGAGFAMSAAAEGYLNLGLLGAAIQVGVMSGLFFMLPLLMAGARDATPLVRASAATLSAFAYNQFRGELTALLKIAVSLGVGVVGIVLLTSVFKLLRQWLINRQPAPGRPARGQRAAHLGRTPAGSALQASRRP